VLHLAHVYKRTAHVDSRFLRVRTAMLETGGAILTAATTTLGASLFLFFCTIQIFVKLGIIIATTTVLAIGVALLPFSAMLAEFGPTREKNNASERRRQVMGALSGGPSGGVTLAGGPRAGGGRGGGIELAPLAERGVPMTMKMQGPDGGTVERAYL